MPRIPADTARRKLEEILTSEGMSPDRAGACAHLFVETHLDGVASHGLNRFPRFVRTIRNGVVEPNAEPERVARFAALERWDGRSGPGNLNAHRAMERTLELADGQGVGVVGLRNTNHWMRGGSYGWQAAEAGKIGLCWTNTMPNLPPWGSDEARIGNNPVVIAVPREAGHVVLDMATSQFSYGTLETYRRRGEHLPVEGGFDAEGSPTRDPAAVLESERPLPTGFWKGSGLSLLLDLTAAMLTGGRATHEVPADPLRETGLSQVFISCDPAHVDAGRGYRSTAEAVIDHLHASPTAEGFDEVRYPGEATLRRRRENSENGLPVDEEVWTEIRELVN